MLQTIVITDLTQMRAGDRVCIAGISSSGQCLRQVSEVREDGVPKALLYAGAQLIVRPRAKFEFDLRRVETQPPHIEDRGFDQSHVVAKGFCTDTEWEAVLRNSASTTVGQIYDQLLQQNKWVLPGSKTKSLGTLAGPKLDDLCLSDTGIKPRLSFRDATKQFFDCPVADLAMRELCYSSVKHEGRQAREVAAEILGMLQQASSVYLRLGLARPFKVTPTTQPRCYLQVTGIYTFPDYLGGKTFQDFTNR